jgi:hypothetical protein
MGIPPFESEVKEVRVWLFHSGLFRREEKIHEALKLAYHEFFLLNCPESIGHYPKTHMGLQIC